MPELPEVQTVVSQLQKEIPGLVIGGVWSDWPKILQVVSHGNHLKIKKTSKKSAAKKLNALFQAFENDVVGRKIQKIERKAKNILIYLSDNYLLLIHQKMTGHFLIGQWEVVDGKALAKTEGALQEKVNSFIHLIFYLSDGRMLALSDMRKFAKAVIGPQDKISALPEIAKLGPDPLDKSFKSSEFKSLINREKRKIKQVLMDQEIISGIGNIYSDEILWQAGIHPATPANMISDEKIGLMYNIMKKILRLAIKAGGDSMSDFRNIYGEAGKFQNYHQVYRREGEKCSHCLTIIKRIKIGGRSAHFCPKCQYE
ncbi:MAG: bifunctional DNA-formamidopyrimidine glycosylase/DNA-(apurinic or apyrimidinic site) lyase [Patescibacteria group bacterium]